MLVPTTPKLRDPDAIPYFAWDLGWPVSRIRQVLAEGSQHDRDEVVLRLLREANTRDVWLFVGWEEIEQAWPRIEHRLGRARGMWQLMRGRRLEHVRAENPE